MSISATALRELHRIHQQLGDLRGRLQRGPKQIKAGEANVARLEVEHEQTKAKFTQARVLSDDKQLQLKQREERIKDLQIKLNSCSSNREYQALKEQIAADDKANSVLSDEILETLEKIDELQLQVGTAEATLAKAREELEKTKKRVSDQQSGLESELARVTAELERAESALPADFRTEYQRIAKARGDEALAPVDGDTCGSCYQTLSPQTMNELYLSRPVFCKSCGCLLYLPEDRSVGRPGEP